MPSFSRLIRFQSASDGKIYFADLGVECDGIPSIGSSLKAYPSIEDLTAGTKVIDTSVGKLLAPVLNDRLPICCVGLNYRSHAAEAKLALSVYPPLWTKPAASLANPDEKIPLNKFCASNFPDFEGELTFVTSKECRDLSPEEAGDYILGYTAGNDLSCRMFQAPDKAGGQFFFAKAFDKFTPLGPTLISPEMMGNGQGMKLTTSVNGEVLQEIDIMHSAGDLVFSPAQILSHMSQSTTISGGTAVMTGTPSGVGVFQSPPRSLRNGDVVEVKISKVGVLKNEIVFI